MRTRIETRVAWTSALFCLLFAFGAFANDELVLAPPSEAPWKPLHFPKIAAHTQFEPAAEAGQPYVRAISQCSASALTHGLEGTNLDETPILEWRWKVPTPLNLPNEKTKAGDDFAARVYVMFEFEPERASWYERARHSLGQTIYGEKIPGNALNYVWSSQSKAGEFWTSPYTGAAKLIALGSGPLEDWRQERVDLAADYRRLFGPDPPPVLAVAIMSDSDNSCGKAEAWFADLRLHERTPEPR